MRKGGPKPPFFPFRWIESIRLARYGVVSPHVVHLGESIGFHEAGRLGGPASRPAVQEVGAGFIQFAQGVWKFSTEPIELFGAGPGSDGAFSGRAAIDNRAVGGIQLRFEFLGRQVAFGHKEHDFLVKDTRLRRHVSNNSANSHTEIIGEV